MAVMAVEVIKAALEEPDKTVLYNPKTVDDWLAEDLRSSLEKKYGYWAVQTALGVVPRGDMEKLEREAKRLYESRLVRGF